jgi:transposase
LPMQTTAPVSSSNISVEILHPRGTVKVDWPTDSAAACAAFLRDLLR